MCSASLSKSERRGENNCHEHLEPTETSRALKEARIRLQESDQTQGNPKNFLEMVKTGSKSGANGKKSSSGGSEGAWIQHDMSSKSIRTPSSKALPVGDR